MKINLNEEQSKILLKIAIKDLLPKELEKKRKIDAESLKTQKINQ